MEVDKLSKLKQLAILDVQNNGIQSVPPELGNLTNIRTLQLEVNISVPLVHVKTYAFRVICSVFPDLLSWPREPELSWPT